MLRPVLLTTEKPPAPALAGTGTAAVDATISRANSLPMNDIIFAKRPWRERGSCCPLLRGLQLVIARARAPAHHGHCAALAIAFLERQSRTAKGALRQQAAKIPVCPIATRAVVHFVL